MKLFLALERALEEKLYSLHSKKDGEAQGPKIPLSPPL